MNGISKGLSRLAPQLVALALVLLIDWFVSPSFFAIQLVDGRLAGSFVDVFIRCAPVALLALGMAAVIATRGIDLSVGAIMAIAGTVAADAVASGQPWYVAMALALTAGLACGIWNGILVAFLGLQPIVATLVLMVAGRGIAQLISGGKIITFNDPAFDALVSGSFLTIPAPVIVVLVVAALLMTLMRRTALGLMIEATGTNPRAAFLIGINTKMVTVSVYAICGVTAALAGLLAAADISGADANNAGLWLELDAILVVVLGGASLLGGSFSYMQTLIGAVTLQAIKTGILLAGFPPQMNLIVMATLISILLIVQAPRTRNWFQQRRHRKKIA